MAKVRVLPEVLAHQIAAGEIVERPAAVAKELVENSLDAGSSRILVEAREGGRRRLCVRDDGEGMSAEDARLAFQHHATSKIRSMDDLNRISTLGFRGEALPSIASVCRLRLRTTQAAPEATGTVAGTEIRYEGGELLSVREIAWPRGTEVEVEDIFFNVPARRNFLKTVPTELGHLTRQVTHYALARPDVEFRLSHQGRVLVEAPPVDSLQERIYQLLGDSFLENLVALDYERAGVRVRGYVSLPHEQRSGSSSQYFYVNRRMVRDRVLTHALRQAYQDLIPASSHPVAILFVEVDPEKVDVNVHPSKTEIRFRDSGSVHSAVYHGIGESLLHNRVSLSSLARDLPSERLRVGEPGAYAERVAQSLQAYFQRGISFPIARTDGQGPFAGGFAAAGAGGAAAAAVAPPPPDPATEDGSRCGEIPETAHLSAAPAVLGQFVESFVVAADREGVMLIDQHVAHERILYDRSLRALNSSDGVPVQRLLGPLTLDLSAARASLMKEMLEALNLNGFEIDWFGERTLAVRGVPAGLSASDVEGVLQEVLEDFDCDSAVEADGSRLKRLREKIAVGVACRAAIKINTPLVPEKMRWLLDELFRCENPYTCPHGRPIVLRLRIEDILRGFKRI